MRAWFACMMWLAGAAGAAEDPALAAVDACRAKLDPRTDVGLERIERKCPDLMTALQGAGWYSLLPQDLRLRRDEISAESLRELAELVRASQQGAATGKAPDLKQLAPALASLGDQGEEGFSRWEWFKRWMREKLQKRAEAEDQEESWLEKLGRQFETSEGVAQAITYFGYALLAALLLLLIYSELRAAGLLGGTRRAGRGLDPRRGWRRRLQLSDVASAPLADRPGLLLRLLGDALSRAHRLPAPEGLTASGIAQRAQLEHETDREELASVASTADAVRYSPRQPAEDELRKAADTAQGLLGKFLKLRAERR